MKTVWDADTRHELGARLGALTPEATARWGRMHARQMLAHLVDAARMALGELDVPARSRLLSWTPLKQFIIYCAPFPRNAPTAPELIARSAEDWAGDVARLERLLGTFASRDPHGSWPRHAAFGSMTGRAWGVLIYRHTDHHLRQFGV